MTRFILMLAGAALVASPPAHAGERGYSVTDFDRLEVSGPVRVIVTTGRGTQARATGTPDALDRLSVEVRSRRLVVRPLKGRWTGAGADRDGPVTLRVQTYGLREAVATGTARAEIDQMKAASVALWSSGSAAIAVASVQADRTSVNQDGAGSVKLAGRSRMADISNKGTGSIDASALEVADLKAGSSSQGETRATATRSANIISWSHGPVIVDGSAACQVKMLGNGEVRCGDRTQ